MSIVRLILLWCLPLFGFWLYGLFDLDEGFYAAITAEMIRRGEWLVPYYNGQPWFEKPILLYWLAKPAVMLFGEDLGPRVPSILAVLGLYGSIYYWLKRWEYKQAALWSSLACSTSLLTVALGRMMLTDALYVCLLTNAFLSFYEVLQGRARYLILTGFCLGFAMLAKGPVAPALFMIIAGLSLWKLPYKINSKVSWLGFGLAFIISISCWYVPIYLAMPDTFWEEFVIRQNIQRFLGGDQAHKVPFGIGLIYYLPVLFIGTFPWSLSLKPAWKQQDHLSTYLKIWISVIFVFFTVSQSKLPHYIFPCLPPLVMLVGLYLQQKPLCFKPRLMHAVSLFFLAQGGFCYWYYVAHPNEEVVRKIGRDLKDCKYPVYFYRRDLRESSRSALGMSLTSHPSMLFYMDKIIPEVKEIAHLKPPFVLLVRGDNKNKYSDYPNDPILTDFEKKYVQNKSYSINRLVYYTVYWAKD